MSATRFILVIVWFGIAAYLLLARPVQGPFGPWAGWFALMFAVYNVFRWWADQPRGLPPPPPHRRRRAHDPPPHMDEYNEAFDFEKDRLPGKPG